MRRTWRASSRRRQLREAVLLAWVLTLAGWVAFPIAGGAQTAIVPNSVAGTAAAVSHAAGSTIFTINGGARSGPNLFQSFSQFSVGKGDTANFNNMDGLPTANIIDRVTGGQVSNINGTIQTSGFGAASFFLLNPSGVVVGPSASLKVGGAFHVSTADSLKFADGKTFLTGVVGGEVLSVAAPTAFGFLGAKKSVIAIDGAMLNAPNGQLSVIGNVQPLKDGTTLLVTGGDIAITGSTLTAPSGQIQLAAGGGSTAGLKTADTVLSAPNGLVEIGNVTSAGVVSLPAAANPTGRIDITKGAKVDVSFDPIVRGPGGTIVIRGGHLVVDQSTLQSNSNTATAAPTGIDVQIANDVSLSNSAGGPQVAQMTAATLGSGRGGDVLITSGTINLTGGSVLRSIATSTGSAGDVIVTATSPGVVTVSGKSTQIASQGSGLSSPGGRVSISATAVNLSAGAQITTSARNGTAGNIELNPIGTLTVSGGAEILATLTRADATGTAGSITVTASGLASLSDPGSGILISNLASGTAGNISLTAGQVSLTGGAQIQAGSVNDQSKGGNVTVSSSGPIAISGGSSISSLSATKAQGLLTVSTPTTLTMDDGFINTSTIGSGAAGNIMVNAGTLAVTGGAQIVSSAALASTTGSGGTVTVTATDSISLSGQSSTGVGNALLGNEPSSGLFSTTKGTQPAGTISVMAPMLTLSDHAKISVATSGPVTAPAGSIVLNAGSLNVTGGASIDSGTTGAGAGGSVTIAAGSVALSGGGLLSSNATSSGPGGNIDVQAGQIALTSGGVVSATSTGTGDAGNITMASSGGLQIHDSVVTTQATRADGGNILLSAPGGLFDELNSQVTTSVQSGQGKGGNITIDPQFVVLDHSQVRADAFGGPGGNINILSDFFLTNDSLVSASSALNAQGTITIQSRFTDVSSSVAPLPAGLLQAATLLRASCAARVASGKASSLVVAGREGVPVEPGGYLPSPLMAMEPGDRGPGAAVDALAWAISPRIPRFALAPVCSR